MSKLLRGLAAGYGARKLGGGCFSTVLIFLLLWSSSLAVSSAHGRSHHSDRPSDQCVLCLFAHGHVIGAESQRVFSLNGSWSVALVLPAYPAAFSTADRRLSPSRAPPLALSAIVVG